eukprot:CAMPEP_0170559994 /NCGR_PEP_ID=MMETSP0211-20121228/46335_1 /TAXON_ID=311385 /ORGANISM="Pseudokeronopsis sp., Strain OXSARD2" /LENGTH=34 /DNA_ID= /DNA_START= /DNA_END= /DNA_ORIENTATION=
MNIEEYSNKKEKGLIEDKEKEYKLMPIKNVIIMP